MFRLHTNEKVGNLARMLFSSKALSGLVRAGDAFQFNIDLKDDRDLIISSASDTIMSGSANIESYSSTIIRGKKCISYSEYSTHLLLRAISRYLQKRFRISLPSRDRIVRGVVETLLDGSPLFAIRRDITSFYESISTDPIKSSAPTGRRFRGGDC
jgi:hypothetical protein